MESKCHEQEKEKNRNLFTAKHFPGMHFLFHTGGGILFVSQHGISFEETTS